MYKTFRSLKNTIMKTKQFILLASSLFVINSAFAQNEKEVIKEVEIIKKGDDKKVKIITNDDKETQEIIIRKNGGKDTKIILDISGGKVLINGKPMAEFNEEGITINNRKMIIRDNNKITMDFTGDFMQGMDDLDDLDGLKEITIDKIDRNNLSFGNGTTTKTFLGVASERDEAGAKIQMVEKNSPAEKAGLLKNDIIYKVDDKKIDGTNPLSTIISSKKEGDNITIYFLRDGKKKEAKATLAKKENSFGINKIYRYKDMQDGKAKSFVFKIPPTADMPLNQPNFEFENQNWDKMYDGQYDGFFEKNKQKLGLKIQDTEEGNGVKVLEVEEESASAKAGLQKDDIVTEIGGKKITNTDEAREQLKENKAKSNGKEMEFSIKIPKKLKTAEL
jgi:serine protease Do